ncbi:MAG: hypothetical protein FD146_2348 [Anaerolineaceae bacterium]|nr:MAG: hypothetical protein FD146_2348 [Anaerolineaceae bacterium]
MNTTLNKIASGLAFLIGGIAVVAGGLVLLGQETDYLVINWLLLYNYTVGVLTVFLTAILIWRNSKLALPAALATFGAHTGVMLILLTAYRGVVSTHSLEDMTVRIAAWLIILTLMFFQLRKNKAAK